MKKYPKIMIFIDFWGIIQTLNTDFSITKTKWNILRPVPQSLCYVWQIWNIRLMIWELYFFLPLHILNFWPLEFQKFLIFWIKIFYWRLEFRIWKYGSLTPNTHWMWVSHVEDLEVWYLGPIPVFLSVCKNTDHGGDRYDS